MCMFFFLIGKEDGKIEIVMYFIIMKCKVIKLLNDKYLFLSSEKLILFKNSGGLY